jgi:hypothetical protein
MQKKMLMNINSLNNTLYYKNISTPLANNANVSTNIQQNKQLNTLNASMIQRIHTTKPGCGACGR